MKQNLLTLNSRSTFLAFIWQVAADIAAVGTILNVFIYDAESERDYRTYQLPDDQRIQYVLRHGRRFLLENLNWENTKSNLAAISELE